MAKRSISRRELLCWLGVDVDDDLTDDARDRLEKHLDNEIVVTAPDSRAMPTEKPTAAICGWEVGEGDNAGKLVLRTCPFPKE